MSFFEPATKTTTPNSYSFSLSPHTKRNGSLFLPPNVDFLASVCLHFSIFRTLANRYFINLNSIKGEKKFQFALLSMKIIFFIVNEVSVAERTLYVWHVNFLTVGLGIYFHPMDNFPGHIEFGESPPDYLFLGNFRAGRTFVCPLPS